MFRPFALASIAIVSLSGCGDSSTPSNSLGQALQAIQRDRISDFQNLLEPSAKETFGSPEKFSELQNSLQKYSHLKIDAEKLVRVEDGDLGFGVSGEILRVYSETILGREKSGEDSLAATVTVQCHRHAVLVSPPSTCSPQPCGPTRLETREVTDCKVLDFKI